MLVNLAVAQAPQYELSGTVRIDARTGVIAAHYNINSPQYSGTPEDIARQYLK